MNELSREGLAELKPCPFCGSPGKMIHPMGHYEAGGYGPDGSRIVCTSDECSGAGWPFYGEDQDARAIAFWNRRAHSDKAKALEEAVHKADSELSMIEGCLAGLRQDFDQFDASSKKLGSNAQRALETIRRRIFEGIQTCAADARTALKDQP